MESTSLEKLRRSVRLAVHRACRRRQEEGDAGWRAGCAEILSLAGAAGASQEARLPQWIADDEADFDRAVLISDLVAARLARQAPSAAFIYSPPAGAAPSTEAPAPGSGTAASSSGGTRAAGSSPAIADLLDQMLAAQRPSASRRP